MSETAPKFDPTVPPTEIYIEALADLPIETWPDYEFDIPEKAVFGRKTIDATPDSSLRGAVRAITEAEPKMTVELANRPAVEIRDQVLAFLKTSQQRGKKYIELINIEDVCLDIWTNDLEKTNHPTVQVWKKIREINEYRKVHNSRAHGGSSYKHQVLSEEILKALLVNLVQSFRPEAVKTDCRAIISNRN